MLLNSPKRNILKTFSLVSAFKHNRNFNDTILASLIVLKAPFLGDNSSIQITVFLDNVQN